MTKGWHRADIKAAISKKGKTLAQLSLENGLENWACRHALAKRHIPGEKAIAACIGVPVWDLWPHRWQEPHHNGGEPVRIDHRFRTKYRRPAPPSHGLKVEAA